MVDLHRRQLVRSSAAAVALSDLDHEEQILATLKEADPDSAFERRWAMTVLDEALQRTERHFRSSGRDRNWEAFAARVVGPALGNCPPVPLIDLAQRLGFATPADAAAAVQAVRKRATLHLREIAAETADHPEEQEDEFLRVLALLTP
jgi:RNA polymerase sigma-70 factor (ECF subfamily)